jgi:hypothetical protein
MIEKNYSVGRCTEPVASPQPSLWLKYGFPVGESYVPVSEISDPTAFKLSGPGFWAEDTDFMACLGDGRLPRVSWQEALAMQTVVEAVYCSAETAQRSVLQEGNCGR